MQIKVNVTPKQSEELQELAIKNGYLWNYSESYVQYCNKPYLIFDTNSQLIQYSIRYGSFGTETHVGYHEAYRILQDTNDTQGTMKQHYAHYAVIVNKNESEMLQHLAFAAGFGWFGKNDIGIIQYTSYSQLIFRMPQMSLGANITHSNYYTNISISDMVIKLGEMIKKREENPPSQEIYIGEHRVTFNPDKNEIKVGCKIISGGVVDEIVQRLNAPTTVDGDTVCYGNNNVTLCGVTVDKETVIKISNCLKKDK